MTSNEPPINLPQPPSDDSEGKPQENDPKQEPLSKYLPELKTVGGSSEKSDKKSNPDPSNQQKNFKTKKITIFYRLSNLLISPLFLNSEENKPPIVNIRSNLKLASPHEIFMVLKNGNMNRNIWIKTQVLSEDTIQLPGWIRIPIGSLKQFKLIDEPLQKLAEMQDIL